MNDENEIERAGSALIDAVAAPAKVIHLSPHSDHDEYDDRFLVIVPEIENRFQEMARLDRLLGRMRIPADVAVATKDEADRPQAKGSLLHEAMTRGRSSPSPKSSDVGSGALRGRIIRMRG